MGMVNSIGSFLYNMSPIQEKVSKEAKGMAALIHLSIYFFIGYKLY